MKLIKVSKVTGQEYVSCTCGSVVFFDRVPRSKRGHTPATALDFWDDHHHCPEETWRVVPEQDKVEFFLPDAPEHIRLLATERWEKLSAGGRTWGQPILPRLAELTVVFRPSSPLTKSAHWAVAFPLWTGQAGPADYSGNVSIEIERLCDFHHDDLWENAKQEVAAQWAAQEAAK